MIKKGKMNKSGKVNKRILIILIIVAILILAPIFFGIFFKSKTLENQADNLDEQAKKSRAQADELEKQIEKASDKDKIDLRTEIDKLRSDANEYERQADLKLNQAADAAEDAAKKLKEKASALRDKTGTRWKEGDLGEKVTIIKERTTGFIKETIPTYFKKITGFEKWGENDLGFWRYLFIGFLTGFWMWLGVFIKNMSGRFTRLIRKKGFKEAREKAKGLQKKEWLDFIAGDFWRIIIIGIGYAIIMQIPIINRFMQIITFELLGVNWFLRSIILAFYIGFGPAWIEQYARYRLRMKYYKKITQIKYGAKMTRGMASG